MNSREEFCNNLTHKVLTPYLQNILVQVLTHAVTQEQQDSKLLTGSMHQRAFGQGMVYAIHTAFQYFILNGLFPIKITENPSSDSRAFPSYILGEGKRSIAIQPYRLKGHEQFPKPAIYREYNINSSQARLFDLEDLRAWGHDISITHLSQYTFAFLLYRANADTGLTMASIGFPLSTDEGPGWIIPLIDILKPTIIVDTDNHVEHAKPVLRPGIIRKQGTDNE